MVSTFIYRDLICLSTVETPILKRLQAFHRNASRVNSDRKRSVRFVETPCAGSTHKAFLRNVGGIFHIVYPKGVPKERRQTNADTIWITKSIKGSLLLLLAVITANYCHSQNMHYVSSRVESINGKNIPGTKHVAVQRLIVVTSGGSNPLSLIRIRRGKYKKATGNRCYIYYSGNDTLLSHAQPLELIEENELLLLKNAVSLQRGENNFWICQSKESHNTDKRISPLISFDLGLQAYRVAWADEFNADTINTGNWGFEKGFVRNEEHQWYQTDNATCNNGILTIEARREKKPNPAYAAGSNNWRSKREFIEYTSTSMRTKDKRQWKYGRFELRARIDTAQGYWPAWWSLGVNRRWPENGEIDMMEFYKGKVLANIAVAAENPRLAHWFSETKPVALFLPGWKDQFHIWRMDWDENGIALYLDDVLLNYQPQRILYNRDGSGFYPFQQEQYMLINLAIGGMNGGDPGPTKFPLKYEVDYVRVLQRIAGQFSDVATYQPSIQSLTSQSYVKPIDGK
jgi:beta-glucanase (GH16 family)